MTKTAIVGALGGVAKAAFDLWEKGINFLIKIEYPILKRNTA
jgi:hypothetical protein